MVIYKTTNMINGKIYIGQDIKNNPKYLGSGKILKLSIRKYGRFNINDTKGFSKKGKIILKYAKYI